MHAVNAQKADLLLSFCRLTRRGGSQLDIPEPVDARVEGAADDGRGLILDDNGWTGKRGAGDKRGPLVDRNLNKGAALGVEDLALRSRSGGRRRRHVGQGSGSPAARVH